MRICIITSSFPMNEEDSFAAAGKACRDFALELEKAGHEVFVSAPRFEGRESGFGNLKIRRFSWGGRGKRLSMLKLSNPLDILEMAGFLLSGIRASTSFIRENRVERVLAMWAVPAGIFAGISRKRLGVPYDVWALGADIWVYGRLPLLKRVVKKVLAGAENVYADGVELCKDVEMLGGKSCSFLPHLPYLGLNDCEPFPLDKAKTNFLFIGRWEGPKGIDILIDAMGLLVSEEKAVHLYVVGGGALEALIRKKIENAGTENYITLLGWVEQKRLVSCLTSCHVLVIPSRVESIPCVYSEAMAAGIPVMVADVGDMGMLTRKYGVGRVARPGDPYSLKDEMKSMMSDNLEGYKKNTKKLADEWDLSEVVKKYLEDIK